MFNGPQDARLLHKTEKVEPLETKEIGQVKLFGDWNLKIKFTYRVL